MHNSHLVERRPLPRIAQCLEAGGRFAGDFLELPAEVGDAAVTQTICDVGKRQFIVDQQLLRFLDLLVNVVLLDRHALDRREQVAQVRVVVKELVPEVLRQPDFFGPFRVLNEVDDVFLRLLDQLAFCVW